MARKLVEVGLIVALVSLLFCGPMALAEEMTEAGTLRSETLVVDMNGDITNVNIWNPYLSGSVPGDLSGPFTWAHLWEINTQTGEMYGEIASELPRALNDENTLFEFKVREGLKWSDGVGFSAYDVEFTGNMLANHPALAASASWNTLVESITATDAHTIQIKTKKPDLRLAQHLGVTVHNNFFKVVPKHIFESVDPASFEYSEPLGLSTYRLVDRDPQGKWLLYEKREDWAATLEGQLVGEAAPKYVLQRFYGLEEKRVIAVQSHELDVVMNLSPESWELIKGIDKLEAWHPEFPYGTFEDPGARGITFNTERFPYNDVDVRWALTLSMDMTKISINSYNGMQGMTPIYIPCVRTLQEKYTFGMNDWLNDFQLSDGFKPYNDSLAVSLTEQLKQQGIEGLPASEQEQKQIFGYGWWKYDAKEATGILEAKGFTQKDGKWYLPDGNPWQINIKVPNFNIHFQRIAYAVSQEWNRFGIDSTVVLQDAATHNTDSMVGEFEVIVGPMAYGTIDDVTSNVLPFHSRYHKPTGEATSGSATRLVSAAVDAAIEKMESLSPDDPALTEATMDFFKVIVREMPAVPMFGGTFIVPCDNTYWTNYPTADNNYAGPWWWWPQFKYVVAHLKAVD